MTMHTIGQFATREQSVTADDRALIEAAVKAGKVRKIPTGETSNERYIWDGHDLIPLTGRGRGSRRASAWNRAQSDEGEAITRRVATCLNGGLSQEQTAEKLGLNIRTVRRHRARAANTGILNQ